MGFMDSIKEALSGEPDKPADDSTPRHIDRDAPAERSYGLEATGGKHAARD